MTRLICWRIKWEEKNSITGIFLLCFANRILQARLKNQIPQSSYSVYPIVIYLYSRKFTKIKVIVLQRFWKKHSFKICGNSEFFSVDHWKFLSGAFFLTEKKSFWLVLRSCSMLWSCVVLSMRTSDRFARYWRKTKFLGYCQFQG